MKNLYKILILGIGAAAISGYLVMSKPDVNKKSRSDYQGNYQRTSTCIIFPNWDLGLDFRGKVAGRLALYHEITEANKYPTKGEIVFGELKELLELNEIKLSETIEQYTRTCNKINYWKKYGTEEILNEERKNLESFIDSLVIRNIGGGKR